MHTLQLLPSLNVGGVERGVVELAERLRARGDRMTVVSSGGGLVPRLEACGATHVTLPVHRKSPLTIARLIPVLARLIQDQQIDVVHARSRMPAWIGYWAARHAQRPFVTTCHGFYSPHPVSHIMGWGRLVIVPSQVVGRYAIDYFGVPAERLRVIPRGVDLAAFPFRGAGGREGREPNEPYRLGLVGRLTTLKGHEVAIRALGQLRHRGAAARLICIGDSPRDTAALRARLQHLAASLGVADAVEWLGIRQDVPACLAQLDALLAPSIYPESFGRSLIEAQAVGVPVIASRLGAFPELVQHERTGLLVSPNQPMLLADAVQRLIQEPQLSSQMAQAARQRVEQEYDLERMVERTRAVYDECLERPRIAIWKLSALGDVVLATPSIRAVRRQYPRGRITLIVGRPLYETVARCPYIDEVIVFDRRGKERTWRGRWRFIRRLQRLSLDRSIDLQNSRLTHALAWLGGITTRIGYRRRWGRLLNQPVELPKAAMRPVAHQYYLLKAAGIEPDGEALELWPSEHDEQAAEALLKSRGIESGASLIGLHIGASPRWESKRWDVERWAGLADRLAQTGATVLLLGGPSDQALGEAVLGRCALKPINLIGATRLLELACILRRCRAFVVGDSAPLHVAAAMGTPTVALFGPTDPARHAPDSPAIRVIKQDVWCSPCYSPRCRTLTHACMKRITVEDVAAAVQEVACASSN